MKKIIIGSILAGIASTGFASVQINLKNIKNDTQVFIVSLQDGQTINAVNAGSYAIVSDLDLKNYSESSTFTVGTTRNNNSTLQYCLDQTKSKQFIFNYKTITNNVISLERIGNTIVCKNLI